MSSGSATWVELPPEAWRAGALWLTPAEADRLDLPLRPGTLSVGGTGHGDASATTAAGRAVWDPAACSLTLDQPHAWTAIALGRAADGALRVRPGGTGATCSDPLLGDYLADRLVSQDQVLLAVEAAGALAGRAYRERRTLGRSADLDARLGDALRGRDARIYPVIGTPSARTVATLLAFSLDLVDGLAADSIVVVGGERTADWWREAAAALAGRWSSRLERGGLRLLSERDFIRGAVAARAIVVVEAADRVVPWAGDTLGPALAGAAAAILLGDSARPDAVPRWAESLSELGEASVAPVCAASPPRAVQPADRRLGVVAAQVGADIDWFRRCVGDRPAAREVWRLRHRRARLAGPGAPLVDWAPQPAVATIDPDRRHRGLIERALVLQGFTFRQAAPGPHLLELLDVPERAWDLRRGEKLALGPGARGDIDVSCGSVAGDRILRRAAAARLAVKPGPSIETSDIPLPPHAPRVRLAGRTVLGSPTVCTTVRAVRPHADGVWEAIREDLDSALVGDIPDRPPEGGQDPRLPTVGVAGELLAFARQRAHEHGAGLSGAVLWPGETTLIAEEWRRDDGLAVEVQVLAAPGQAPAYADGLGGALRAVDICDYVHLADPDRLRSCGCGRNLCGVCRREGLVRACALCGETACVNCGAERLCARCAAPERDAAKDTATERAWRAGNVLLWVSAGLVRLRRPRAPDEILLEDSQVEDPADAARRQLLSAAGLPLDWGVEQVTVSAPPSTDALWSRDVVRESLRLGTDEIEPDHRAPHARTVRALGAYGLEELATRLRKAAPPPSTGTLRQVLEVERHEVGLAPGGLVYRCTRHLPEGVVQVVAAEDVVLRSRTRSVDLEDGLLVAEGKIREIDVALLRLQRSFVLRLVVFGERRDFYAGARGAGGHGVDLAWHRLRRAHAFDAEAVLVRDRDPLSSEPAGAFASPKLAELVERQIAPRPRFAPSDVPGRTLTADDLAAAGRSPFATRSVQLRGATRKAVTALGEALAPPERPWLVSVAHQVAETWQGVGRRSVSYVVEPGEPAWPPREVDESPLSDFGVDTAGHLHAPGDGWHCSACATSFCTACENAELGPCGSCRQPTCGRCRAGAPITVTEATCERCGLVACGACGRDVDPRECIVCARSVCVRCAPEGACATCRSLRPAKPTEVPEWVPVAGCRIVAARDGEFTVVGIRGADRQEFLVLRPGRRPRWLSADPDRGRARAALAAARHVGKDRALPDPMALPAPGPPEDAGPVVAARMEIHVSMSTAAGERRRTARRSEEFYDAVAAVLGGRGKSPDPVSWPEGVSLPLPDPPASKPLAVGVELVPITHSLTAEGLVVVRCPPGGPPVQRRSRWVEDTTRPGPRRWRAAVDRLEVVIEAAGRDVRAHVHDGDTSRLLHLARHDDDRTAARLAVAAGWAKEPPRIGAFADPEGTPLEVSGSDGLVERYRTPMARQAPPARAGAGMLAEAAAALGQWCEPDQEPDATLDGAGDGSLMAAFSRIPTQTVDLGFAVEEVHRLGATTATVRYQVWPAGGGLVAEIAGRRVERVYLDRQGHAALAVEQCRYCQELSCGDCDVQMAYCPVCGIERCTRCGGGGAVCPACTGMTRSPRRTVRKVIGGRLPRGAASGADAAHRVVAARRPREAVLVVDGRAAGTARSTTTYPKGHAVWVYVLAATKRAKRTRKRKRV